MSEIRIDRDYASLFRSVRYENQKEDGTVLPSVPIVRERMVRTPTLFRKIIERREPQVLLQQRGILPQNTRFVSEHKGLTIYAIEEPPSIRSILVSGSVFSPMIEKLKMSGRMSDPDVEFYTYDRDKGEYRISLSFPYVVYIFPVYRTGDRRGTASPRIFFRLTPITSLNDYLFKVPLSNISIAQKLCLGSLGRDYSLGDLTKMGDTEFINLALTSFWYNSFNSDYFYNPANYQNKQLISDYANWAYNTQMDPMFIYDVEWIPWGYSLGEVIINIGENWDKKMSNFNTNAYKIFENAFYPRAEDSVGSQQLPNGEPISTDCESISLSNGRVIGIGDELKFKNATVYVDMFISHRYHNPHEMQVETEDGKMRILKLTHKFKDILVKQFERPEISEIELEDGTIAKVGDILIVDNNTVTVYKTLYKIRTRRDGEIEALLGDDYYIFKNVKVTKMDINNITYEGRVMIPGERYFLSNTSGIHSTPDQNLIRVIFRGIGINRNDVGFEFASTSNPENTDFFVTPSDMPSTSTRHQRRIVFPERQFQTPLLRFGCNIYVSRENSYTVIPEGTIGVLNELNTRDTDMRRRFRFEQADDELLYTNEDQNEIYVPSYDYDARYKIGDKVVYAVWDEPEKMTHIWEITGFTSTDTAFNIVIRDTEDPEAPEVVFPYILRDGAYIREGVIRHISQEYRQTWINTETQEVREVYIKSGSKIKSAVSGNQNFPKKDTHRIIGVITDTDGIPLILCSNLCTIWAHPKYLNKYNIFEEGTLGYNKYSFTPRPEPAEMVRKIKVQEGDFFKDYNGNPIFVSSSFRGGKKIIYIYNIIYGAYPYGLRISETRNRYGFVKPRFGPKFIRENFSRKRMFPALNGSVVMGDSYIVRLKTDWDMYIQPEIGWRMSNVSDTCS